MGAATFSSFPLSEIGRSHQSVKVRVSRGRWGVRRQEGLECPMGK